MRDVHEFLDDLGLIAPRGPLPITATYHDACHLAHAQRIRQQPRDLLKLIPGITLVPLAESDICCGAAGSYNLTEAEMADLLFAWRVAKFVKSNAIVYARNGQLLSSGAGQMSRVFSPSRTAPPPPTPSSPSPTASRRSPKPAPPPSSSLAAR